MMRISTWNSDALATCYENMFNNRRNIAGEFERELDSPAEKQRM